MFKCFQTYLFVFHLEHPFDVANSLLHESWRSVVQRYAIRECALINEMRLATQFWRLTAFQRYPITRVFYSLLVLSHPQITTFLKIFTKLSHLNTSFFILSQYFILFWDPKSFKQYITEHFLATMIIWLLYCVLINS